ncbi:MAG: STAS domain-containing protein [Acidobacteriota bacterium]
MQVSTRMDADVLMVKLETPRLDAANAVDFREALADFVDQGHAKIVIDLESVEFVDSSGLNVIISTLKRMGRRGSLSLTSPQPPVSSLLNLTRLDRVLNIFSSSEQALTELTA